jgi:hypothetical protein
VWPHAPQLAGSPITSTQTPEQVVRPPSQLHAPLTQACPPKQRLLQKPQFVGSIAKIAQLLPQAISPAAQVAEHMVCEQSRPPVHALPQVPQLAPSELRFVQPVVHDESPPAHWHLPAEHDWPSAHFTPHAPQF